MVWLERQSNWKKSLNDSRSAGDVDYGRVIHSGSFRRLQGKTQILNLGDSDFYRTRLTHSLEVAQIAGGITSQIKHCFPKHDAINHLPEHNLIQAIACTHDLGHPPFGHGGEVALNYCMHKDGGFEGNGQTLRILSTLEKFSKNHGSDLTRETLLGVLKYPVAYSKAKNPIKTPRMMEDTSGIPILDRSSSKPPKCYMDSESSVVEWLLSPLNAKDRDIFQSYTVNSNHHHKANHKSFACSIMDLADDISFGIHDMEDSIALRLVTKEQFRENVPANTCQSFLDYLNSKYPGQYGNDIYEELISRLFADGNQRKHQISRILNFIIPSVEISENPDFTEPRLRYSAQLPKTVDFFVKALKTFIKKRVIFSPSVQHLEMKGQMMVIAVFEVIKSDPKSFLPQDFHSSLEASTEPLRVICDYVAGMTDAYLLKTYERLFAPRMGSVFDRL